MSLRRRNSLGLLVSKLDTKVIDKFLNLQIKKSDLDKFDEMEKREMLQELTDLKYLKNTTESEIYKSLDLMLSNEQYFIYCGPLLLNINPGPDRVDDYLNLANWMQKNSGTPHTKWKPHLYTMMNNVYHTLIKEKKDQAVNFLGQIGSGKTFNLVHSLEYFCFFYAPEGMQMDFFEKMHKSMQLMHIMGSVFRENNVESSSCGINLKMGFDSENFKICNFDLESKLIDFTLPFSESGRSFSILHSLVTGASPEIKRILDLPDRETTLNFFKKYHSSFNGKTKERFKLNDYEIWTRFHSLLNYFEFTKNEVIEVLQLMAFILLCNEAAIGKKRTSSGDEYVINKSVGSKKLAKNLNIEEEDFLKRFGTFKDISEMKNCLISMMKYAYYTVFEYVKNRVKSNLHNYFEKYRPQMRGSKKLDQSFSQNNSNIKYIYFFDIPGEIKDQTLGGLFTNLTNECLNLYTGSEYMCVVDKLKSESSDIKFSPIHSFYTVESLVGKDGLINFLSQNFTEKNFKKLKSKIARKEHFFKTIKFMENLSNDVTVDFTFEFKFCNKNIFYNYESIYLETKSLHLNPKVLKIFEGSKNSVMKSQIKYLQSIPKNFYTHSMNVLTELFKSLEGINPFIIYCIHSNKSLKTFFGEKRLNIIDSENNNINIPNLDTKELLRNSMIFPIIKWEWFGFHEWMEVELFIKEFRRDFESVKEKIFKKKTKGLKKKEPDSMEDINFKSLDNHEVINYMLSVLCLPNQYLIGKEFVLMKKGTLKKIRELVTNMVNLNKVESMNIVNNSIDGKMKKRSSQDRSKGSIYKRNPSMRSASIGDVKNTQSLASLKNTNTKGSSKNFESSPKIKITRNNSLGSKVGLRYDEKNNQENDVEYYKPHCSLKVFKDHDNLNNLMNNNNEINAQGKVNLNMNSKANLGSICDYNLNNEQINLVDDNNMNEFMDYNNKYNLFSYLAFNKKIIDVSSLNDSYDHIHTTNLESEFDMYKRDENVIVPKTKHFKAIKNLLDYEKIEGFHIFDYQENLGSIKMIQNNWRSYKARKVYKIFRYVCKKCVMIQKLVRSLLTKKKFEKFKYANKCIVLIQKLYKRRFIKLNNSATKIQSIFRKNKGFKKYLDKLARQDAGEDDSDEEFNNNMTNKHGQVFTKGGKENIKRELNNVSISKWEKKRNFDSSSVIRGNQLNMSLFAEMEPETDKRKILDVLLKDSVVMKGLANKNFRQLHNDVEMNKKNFEGKGGYVRKLNSGKKIQDRLIEFGEMAKMKQTSKKLEQLKEEEKNLDFKPKLYNNKSKINLANHGGMTIQERTEHRKILKEKKIEALRNKYQDDTTELTFKPQLNRKSMHIKRSVNDLYKWKEKNDLVKQREINDKLNLEEEEIKKNLQSVKVNKKSEILHRNKTSMELLRKEEDEKDEIEFDLWPDIDKEYVKDDDDLENNEDEENDNDIELEI